MAMPRLGLGWMPGGSVRLVKDLCALRGLSEETLTDDDRQRLIEELQKGHRAYA